ncbi:PSMB7_1 [Blepharisma stoltei]|uniref:Proteasome subunit beta n=1 Tax=Blepharisma stoltei TaxID=1481888 RepID=A0AAU9IE48_9CILI|nr:unnamed protein product [Blepharisma stoltei]
MDYLDQLPIDGFNHDLFERNKNLLDQGVAPKPYTKTGTTIVGLMYEGGVVLGADTRATGGSMVLDKMCDKLHMLAPNIFAAGAGTAADLEHVTLNIGYQLELLRLYSGRQSRVITAITLLTEHLFKYGGNIGAYLIVGGVDASGAQLFMISADGTYRHHPFHTMGSGSLAAMSMFETEYRDHMTKEEAMQLVAKAIEAGIFNDLGSGSSVDLVAIDKDGHDHKRTLRNYNKKAYQSSIQYNFPKGVTPIKREYPLVITEVSAMEIE